MTEAPDRHRYLLDTTALIDFSKGFEPSRTKVLELIDSGQEVGVCAVTVAEFFAGLAPTERPSWQEFVAELPYWHISPEAAAQAGTWRYEFHRRGVHISTTDALVAAAAWEQRAIVVTNDARHYPMPEIRQWSARG